MKNPALIQNLKNALTGAASLLFGVNEIMFLAGLLMLYVGLTGLWSRDGALTVCGGILLAVGVLGTISQTRKGREP